MAINQYLRYPTKTDAPSAAYPYGSARNISVPGDGTGTPWEQAIVNDLWGWMQQLLDAASIVPTNSPDEVGASQYFTAMRATAGYPGLIVPMAINTDPATAGLRILALDGSGILRANYSDLDSAVYIGDANNPTAGAFYRADDAAGTSRNTTGSYLILPDTRGAFPRGLDPTGTVDPDGATRFVGDAQDWGMADHFHEILQKTGGADFKEYTSDNITEGTPGETLAVVSASGDQVYAEDIRKTDYGPFGNAETESRPVNFAVNWGIWY